MDEKVLKVLIDRVEDSSCNYTIHKNEQWKECLESDKDRLINYVMKNYRNISQYVLPNTFKFIADINEGIVYTAYKFDNKKYIIKWFKDENEELELDEELIASRIKLGTWKIVD